MDTKTSGNPDWGLRIGLSLWIALGWLVFHILGWHIPSWFIYGLFIGLGGFYILNMLDDSLGTLAKEIEKTNARIDILEDSIRDKFHEINRKLPDED